MITECFNLCGNKFYFCTWDVDGIFAYDYVKEKLEQCLHDDMKLEEYRQFGHSVLHDGVIYFSPMNGSDFAEYIIEKNILIKYRNPFFVDAKCNSFLSVFTYGDFIYFVGATFPGIVKHNSKSKEWFLVDSWVKEIKKLLKRDTVSFFSRGVCIIGSKAYLVCNHIIMELNLLDDSWHMHEVGNSNYKYTDMTFDGEKIWLAPCYAFQPVVTWNPLSKKTEYIDISDEKNKKDEPWRITYVNKKIWLLPLSMTLSEHRNFLLSIANVKNDKGEYDIDSLQLNEKLPQTILAWLVYTYENTIYFNDGHTGSYFVLDTKTKRISQLDFHVSIADILKSGLHSIVQEETKSSLEEFLEYINDER